MAKILKRFDESVDTEPIKLDKKDIRLITLLAENSRIQLVKLARAVNLSKDAVAYRIRKMQEKGFILKFVPIVNIGAFGFASYHIFLLLKEGEEERKQKMMLELERNPNVRVIMEYSDRWDFEIVIVARNTLEMDEIKEKMFEDYFDLIIQRSIVETVKLYSSNYFPTRSFDKKFNMVERIDPNRKKYDKMDLDILENLSEDCRKSNYEVARALSLSPDTVHNRIKRMVDENIIEKFTAIVNLNMLNFHWYTFALNINSMNSRSESKLKAFISSNGNIIRASKVLGDWDLIFYILWDSTRSFHSTVKQLKKEFSSQIESHDTWVAYKEHYFCSFPDAIWLSGNA